MRSNEEASSVGALLVAAAADPDFSRKQLADGISAEEQYLRRFDDLGEPAEVSLVDTVDHGEAGTRLRQIIADVNAVGQGASITEVSDALTAALTYTALRRLAQDRAARGIATGAQSRASVARITAWAVGAGAAVLFALVVLLGVVVSASISRPLRRLTRAARVVADLSRAELVRVADSDQPDPAPPRLAAVEVDSADEIGELATALNRVQATAALLFERQTTSRRNVGVMFANIARRTQNLVGRQLTLIDDLERNERSAELLQRLYRLDHVATRLRRSADSLLVVSGHHRPGHLRRPERAGRCDPGLVGRDRRLPGGRAGGDLLGGGGGQLGQSTSACSLAELLENATNFSPPSSPVVVRAVIRDRDCHIAIVDHGLGMSPTRLADENRRLVERERLEVAPTNVLGLFVVGRLARRHGLGVSLEQSDPRGVTARVRIPARLLTGVTVTGLPAASIRTRPAPHPAIVAIDAIEVEVSSEPFDWFDRSGEHLVAISSVAQPPPSTRMSTGPYRPDESVSWHDAPPNGGPHAPASGRASLPRVDASYPSASPEDQFPGDPGLPRRSPRLAGAPDPIDDAAAARGRIPSRGGLMRRVPGTHLAPEVSADASAPAQRGARDPEAERAALNDYLSGLARSDGPNPAERS